MRQTLITRHDDDIGMGTFDSIAWAFAHHVKAEDTGDYDSAMLYGNEDSPDRIDFYKSESPLVTDTPAFVWRPIKETKE